MRRQVHKFHAKRQLQPILSGIFNPALPTLQVPGPLGGVTSILPLPSLSLSIPTTTTTSANLPSFSSSSLVASSESSASTTSSSSESSSDTFTTPTPTPTPTSAPSPVQTVFETTSGGKVHTITTFVDNVPSTSATVVPPTPPKSFLQNKVLSGVVFTLIGIVGFAIILAIVTFAIKRRRKNRLVKEAISFDPTSTTDNHHHGFGKERGSFEKRSVLTRSSNEAHPPGLQAYNSGPSYPFGQDPNLTLGGGYTFSKPPTLTHEYVHGPDRALPPLTRSEDVNWGPSLAPYTTSSGSPDPHVGHSADERAQSQNRLLKITNN